MNAQELREIYDRDLKELQYNCKHEKSEWMQYSWAPGHMGAMVLVCECCEKTLNIE